MKETVAHGTTTDAALYRCDGLSLILMLLIIANNFRSRERVSPPYREYSIAYGFSSSHLTFCDRALVFCCFVACFLSCLLGCSALVVRP